MSTWELLHDLRESERERTVIKLKVKGFDKPIIAAVDKVTSKEVILKPLTLFGERLENTIIPLAKIERLVKFNLTYQQGIFPVFRRDTNGLPAIEVKTTRKVRKQNDRKGIRRFDD